MNIIIYGLPHCHMCRTLKMKLMEKGYNPTYIDDEDSVLILSETFGFSSVPIVKINDKYYNTLSEVFQVLGI